jgi:hypothetical protein
MTTSGLSVYSLLQAEVVAAAFEQPDPWDMVCANGVMSQWDMRYYDAFAYRSDVFPDGPVVHPLLPLKSLTIWGLA